MEKLFMVASIVLGVALVVLVVYLCIRTVKDGGFGVLFAIIGFIVFIALLHLFGLSWGGVTFLIDISLIAAGIYAISKKHKK